MPVPTTLGTDMSGADSAVRVAVIEAPTATALAVATNSALATVTINAGQGLITTPPLTTSLAYSLVVTNSVVSSGDIVWVQPQNGTNTAAVQLSAGLITVGSGTFSAVFNNTQTTAHNGTLQIAFQVQKLVTKYAVD